MLNARWKLSIYHSQSSGLPFGFCAPNIRASISSANLDGTSLNHQPPLLPTDTAKWVQAIEIRLSDEILQLCNTHTRPPGSRASTGCSESLIRNLFLRRRSDLIRLTDQYKLTQCLDSHGATLDFVKDSNKAGSVQERCRQRYVLSSTCSTYLYRNRAPPLAFHVE